MTVTGVNGGNTATVTVIQTGATSTFSVSPSAWNVPASGGTQTFVVTSSVGDASWTATTDAGWLYVTSITGPGSGTVTLSAGAQWSNTPRTATAMIAGRAVTVTQPGASTTVTLTSPAEVAVSAARTSLQVEWTATSGNATIASTSTWLTVSCGGDIVGANSCTTQNGPGTYGRTVTIAVNPSAQPRTGTVTVTGLNGGNIVTLAVTQAGATPTFSVSPSALWNAAVGGATQTIAVTSSLADASWTATSDAAWLTVAPTTGLGSGVVTLTAAAQTSETPRTATATIAGQAVMVTQDGFTRIIGLNGSLIFGNTAVNTTATRTLTIDNTGSGTLSVTSIDYPAGFSGAWSGTIAADTSQTVVVTFRPTLGVGYSGVITVNSDSLAGFNTTPASGTGTLHFSDDGKPDILWHHQPSGML